MAKIDITDTSGKKVASTDLADGAPVLINEIGEAPRVRVVAQRKR